METEAWMKKTKLRYSVHTFPPFGNKADSADLLWDKPEVAVQRWAIDELRITKCYKDCLSVATSHLFISVNDARLFGRTQY